MSPKLPVVSGPQMVRALEKAGFRQVGQGGSHVKLRSAPASGAPAPLVAKVAGTVDVFGPLGFDKNLRRLPSKRPSHELREHGREVGAHLSAGDRHSRNLRGRGGSQRSRDGRGGFGRAPVGEDSFSLEDRRVDRSSAPMRWGTSNSISPCKRTRMASLKKSG